MGEGGPLVLRRSKKREAIGCPNLLVLHHYFLNIKGKECSPVQTLSVYSLELGLYEGDFLADVTVSIQNSISQLNKVQNYHNLITS